MKTTMETTTMETMTERPGRRTRKRRFRRLPQPAIPVRGLLLAATEEERQRAQETCWTILEVWLGKTGKSEAARRLGVAPLRVWQLSQQALSGMIAGLLTQPRTRQKVAPGTGVMRLVGRPASADAKELTREIRRLKEDLLACQRVNALLKAFRDPAPEVEAGHGRRKSAGRSRQRQAKAPRGARRAAADRSRTAPRPIPARVGRPPASPAKRREALKLVRREMKLQGRTAGWRPIAAALEGRVSTRLVQWALATWKCRAARRLAARHRENRTSLEPSIPNVLWSLDAMQVGRVEGQALLVEQVVEVATTATLGVAFGQSVGGVEVVQALEAAVARQGAPPLVVATDGGGENVSQLVHDWCVENGVVRLLNVPNTPEHNPWVERKHRDVRAESGLRSHSPLGSWAEAERRLEAALTVLDRGRRRRKLGYRTAAAGDMRPALVYSRAQRERLYAAVADAVRAAQSDCKRLRDRRRAEREATVRVLAEFGLLRWTRGGVPVPTVVAEIIS